MAEITNFADSCRLNVQSGLLLQYVIHMQRINKTYMLNYQCLLSMI